MLNSAPNRLTINEVICYINKGSSVQTKQGYEPARAFGFYSFSHRLRLAWDVFTGKADALYWPNQPPPKAY